MRILAIETSTYSGSIAVSNGEEILGEFYFNMGPSHSEKLVPSIDWLLSGLKMAKSELDGVAVSLGPGSFTALRVGISTAKGIAYSLGIPVTGASSLEILAMNLPFSRYQICSLIDARKGEYFAALFRSDDGRIERIAEDRAYSPMGLTEIIKEKTIFIGEGALLYKDFLEDNQVGGRELADFCPPYLNYPRASSLALHGSGRLEEGLTEDLFGLAPHYLRKSDAELSTKGRYHDRIGHN
ncbi:MAG: tRNA (adenosine(37)-N6)-threonylcarbamoyltransferase complex dimerization subunit type 1 TsaB [Deltaproteobacteria bacterium]